MEKEELVAGSSWTFKDRILPPGKTATTVKPFLIRRKKWQKRGCWKASR